MAAYYTSKEALMFKSTDARNLNSQQMRSGDRMGLRRSQKTLLLFLSLGFVTLNANEAIAGHLYKKTSECANVCVADSDRSGYVSVYPQANFRENVRDFSVYAYDTGLPINDRIASIRFKGPGGPYWYRACFYRDQGLKVLRSSVGYKHPGWYDNQKIDISSFQGVAGNCPQG